MRRSNDCFLIFGDLAFFMFVTMVAGYVFVSVKASKSPASPETQNKVQVMGVEIPRIEAGAGTQQASQQALEITIHQSGRTTVGDRQTAESGLREAIRGAAATACTVITDRAAPAEALLQVFAAVQECNISSVQVVYQTAAQAKGTH